jgi:predicted transcriptional regulator
MRYFNHLRAHREALSLRQWDVSVQTGITLDRYGRLENGQAQPAFAEGVRLGAFFKVAPIALFPVEDHAQAS